MDREVREGVADSTYTDLENVKTIARQLSLETQHSRIRPLVAENTSSTRSIQICPHQSPPSSPHSPDSPLPPPATDQTLPHCKHRRWNHSRAPRMTLLFGGESGRSGLFLGKLGRWSPSRLGIAKAGGGTGRGSGRSGRAGGGLAPS